MSMLIKEELNTVLADALRTVAGEKADALALDRCLFGEPKQPEHGELATSAPLVCAKPLGRKPLDIAGDLATALASHPLVASAEVAKPGFVNLRLSPHAIGRILSASDDPGHGGADLGRGRSVLLEFVSANPTGPMHIGHCRHAATGDALARILAAAGYNVTREFYINDAGVQIAALGESFRARCLEALGEAVDTESLQYSGEYLTEFARDFVSSLTPDQVRSLTLDQFADEARRRNLDMIRTDLAAMGVFFDHYQSEKELHDANAVEETLQLLITRGATHEKDGALWLRTGDHGDDKDRVLRKGDGTVTYLVPDLAYHHHKFNRGYDRYINIFGADHSGYPPRLRAGIAFLGHDETKLEVLLLRLVFLVKGGQRVKFSKRAGNFVALSDVVAEAGPDATRWFMLCRSLDSEFEFDMDLATESSNNNPVYKVQYAHARICTLMEKARGEMNLTPLADAEAAARKLVEPIERELIMHLSRFPEIVARSAAELAVHHLPNYLLTVAEFWNRYYSMGKVNDRFRFLAPENHDVAPARLRLAAATRRVIANGLALMGISAPTEMSRDAEDDE